MGVARIGSAFGLTGFTGFDGFDTAGIGLTGVGRTDAGAGLTGVSLASRGGWLDGGFTEGRAAGVGFGGREDGLALGRLCGVTTPRSCIAASSGVEERSPDRSGGEHLTLATSCFRDRCPAFQDEYLGMLEVFGECALERERGAGCIVGVREPRYEGPV